MSFASEMLSKVENILLGKDDTEFIEYNGVKVTKSDMVKLSEIRDKLRREVAIEEKYAKTGIPKIVTRF
jgi:hypothetical protein